METGSARISAFLRLFGLGGFAFQRIRPDVDSGWDGAGMRPGGGNGGERDGGSHGVGTGVDGRDEGRLGGDCGGDAVDAGMLPGKGLA